MSISNETRKPLLPQHRKLIEDSGIEDPIIRVRGYYSETVKSDLAKLGFSYTQRVVPALVVPIGRIRDLSGICVSEADLGQDP